MRLHTTVATLSCVYHSRDAERIRTFISIESSSLLVYSAYPLNAKGDRSLNNGDVCRSFRADPRNTITTIREGGLACTSGIVGYWGAGVSQVEKVRVCSHTYTVSRLKGQPSSFQQCRAKETPTPSAGQLVSNIRKHHLDVDDAYAHVLPFFIVLVGHFTVSSERRGGRGRPKGRGEGGGEEVVAGAPL
jgi:hypothetical protein